MLFTTCNCDTADVPPASSVRNLGVMFDSVMNMDAQVTAICKSAYHQLHNIGCIRRYLTADVTAQLVHAFVTSRLDYCNSLLNGITDKSLKRLRKVQNTSARIITLTRKYDHITPIFKSLHWLPINLRIEFKILLLAYKALHGLAPAYLSELISWHQPMMNLRSTNQDLLVVPSCKTSPTFGDRAFSMAAPRLWNELPRDLRSAKTLGTFKNKLKTYLFRKY